MLVLAWAWLWGPDRKVRCREGRALWLNRTKTTPHSISISSSISSRKSMHIMRVNTTTMIITTMTTMVMMVVALSFLFLLQSHLCYPQCTVKTMMTTRKTMGIVVAETMVMTHIHSNNINKTRSSSSSNSNSSSSSSSIMKMMQLTILQPVMQLILQLMMRTMTTLELFLSHSPYSAALV